MTSSFCSRSVAYRLSRSSPTVKMPDKAFRVSFDVVHVREGLRHWRREAPQTGTDQLRTPMCRSLRSNRTKIR